MENNNALTIVGVASGALILGVPGAIIGGVIGSVLQEIIYCPVCEAAMKFINGWWRCSRCGYTKIN